MLPPSFAEVLTPGAPFPVTDLGRAVAGKLAGSHDLGDGQAISLSACLGQVVVMAGLEPVPFGKDVEPPDLRPRGRCGLCHKHFSSLYFSRGARGPQAGDGLSLGRMSGVNTSQAVGSPALHFPGGQARLP